MIGGRKLPGNVGLIKVTATDVVIASIGMVGLADEVAADRERANDSSPTSCG